MQLETVLENFAAKVREDVDALRTEIDDLKRENTELKAELANVKGSNASLNKIVHNLPTPKDGKDADPIAILNHVENIIDKRVAQIELKQGPQGPQGERGEKGDTGERGEQGPQGEVGPKGDEGERGAVGQKGEKGDTGERGEQGPQGPQGERGVDVEDITTNKDGETVIHLSNDIDFNLGVLRGEKGDAGPQGERGPQGEPGPKGEIGIQGPIGEKGEVGERGPQGERGEKGADGLVGERGEPGPQGERGEKGDTGERGEKGPKGDAGVGIHKSWIDQEGCLVQLLTNEREDNLGPVVGPEGPAGRDALGVGDFKAAFDGRNFTIGLSNGVISKTEQFYLPIPMPAGKYESEKNYFAGDIVRYKGSSYIAGGIPSDRPGFDDVWFMLAEKGKDGPKGDKGEEGKPGRAGMDLTHVDSQGNKFG